MTALGPGPALPLFVYGTLLDPAFTSQLLERPVAAEPAWLLDHAPLAIEGWPLPALREAPGERAEGRLYRALTPEDYARLDHYEGVHEGLYRRIAARVIPAPGRAPEPAFVYLVTEGALARRRRR